MSFWATHLLCPLVLLALRDAPSHLTVECCWPAQPYDLVILIGLSSRWAVSATSSLDVLCSEILSVPGPRNIPKVVSQKAFSSLAQRAWPRSRAARIFTVILPLGSATTLHGMFSHHRYFHHHGAYWTIWPKWQEVLVAAAGARCRALHVIQCTGLVQPGQSFHPSGDT